MEIPQECIRLYKSNTGADVSSSTTPFKILLRQHSITVRVQFIKTIAVQLWYFGSFNLHIVIHVQSLKQTLFDYLFSQHFPAANRNCTGRRAFTRRNDYIEVADQFATVAALHA